MARLIPGILLTVIAVLLIVLATSRETGAQFGGNGRYQLVADGTGDVWRIDTRTGDVSACGGASDADNGSVGFRILVPESEAGLFRTGCIRFPELEPPQ